MLAKNISGITVDDVDKLYESFDEKTFGQVINAAKAKFSVSSDLEADLAIALKQRTISLIGSSWSTTSISWFRPVEGK